VIRAGSCHKTAGMPLAVVRTPPCRHGPFGIASLKWRQHHSALTCRPYCGPYESLGFSGGVREQ